MSTEQELNDSIAQYEKQLSQVEQAIVAANSQEERKDLENLKSDLSELLKLTRETLEHEHGGGAEKSNPIDDEFARFMAEINATDDVQPTNVVEPDEDMSESFKDLIGSKCSAPHVHKWGSEAHHNALICSLDSSNLAEVMVKVLYINPTHQEMIPCSYYLEGECKFSDEKCRFSHGETVLLKELKEYREPKFELLKKKGAVVLAKQKNRLWGKGTVKDTDFTNKTCRVQLDESKRELELPFEDVFPIDSKDDNDEGSASNSGSETDSSNDELFEGNSRAIDYAQIIQKSLLNPSAADRLGDWEKHTKGIGSKIMRKMGYVIGSGLGSKGDGIVVPVGAQVLPQGKSLDYCMQLREQANGERDLFSVEKKLKRQQMIKAKQDAQTYARNKRKKDVFSFINSDILGSSEDGSGTSSKNSKLDLPSCSSKNLNIASLKLAEQTKRLEMEVERMTHSLTRHQPGSQMHSSIRKQITSKQAEIAQAQATEQTISREQRLRSDKKKLTVF
ncbi:zinc finger CCCH-type with G patch domain-containing protein [Toxorhynchites rutilus septentrionalis]|uniref:zinc finger CCCH-type with G patch domain-containing protein n=1 Tax=Toxorhynchites rutilus septentrionalis TaxID=329112 RepID=UPI00247A10FF|nr:zinc finger CCCH-type with G patch domain-containing protein [Toxorhynchites rutilus septentrionalis]